MSEEIRLASAADAAEILKIYAPFITDTAVSFEYEVPSSEEFAERIRQIGAEYPYLVYVRDGVIIGYAYAHRYLERIAYQWDVEVTIYLAPAAQKKGVGKKLYAALESVLAKQHIINLYACITASNMDSINFHRKAGYALAGTFVKAGFKQGAWQDVVWMAKSIGSFADEPEKPVKISELTPAVIAEALQV